jgi:hypothetical protein
LIQPLSPLPAAAAAPVDAGSCAGVSCILCICREAANAIRFAQVFAFMPEVVVPQMHLEFTTSRVLVMQWIEGERLRSASQVVAAAAAAATAGGGSSSRGGSGQGPLQQQQASSSSSGNTQKVADDLRLVEIGVRCSLEQMLEEGYFHAGGFGALGIAVGWGRGG